MSLRGSGVEELRKLPPHSLFPHHGILEGQVLRWQCHKMKRAWVSESRNGEETLISLIRLYVSEK